MNGLLPDSLNNVLKKFRLDSDYKEFVRAGFFALLIRVSGIFTGFLVTLFTARFFGADALGIVAICLAVLSFASVFGKLGLDVAIIKYIPSFAVRNNYAAIKGVYLNVLKIILPLTVMISLLLFL